MDKIFYFTQIQHSSQRIFRKPLKNSNEPGRIFLRLLYLQKYFCLYYLNNSLFVSYYLKFHQQIKSKYLITVIVVNLFKTLSIESYFASSVMQNFVYTPHLHQVPQWKQCYYDWQTLKEMLRFLKRCIKTSQWIEHKYRKKSKKRLGLTQNSIYGPSQFNDTLQTFRNIQQTAPQPSIQNITNKNENNYTTNYITPLKSSARSNKSLVHSQKSVAQSQKSNIYSQRGNFYSQRSTFALIFTSGEEMRDIINCWVQKFKQYSDRQQDICYMFTQLKLFQIQGKLKTYQKLLEIVKKDHQQRTNIIILFQNLYIEADYLQKAITYNISREEYIAVSVRNTIKDREEFENILHLEEGNRLHRLKNKNAGILNQIELNCARYRHVIGQSAQQTIIKSNTGQNQISRSELFFIGAAMGANCLMVGVLIMSTMISSISIEHSEIFRNHFPVWRGASYVLMFMWMLGISVLFYEKAQINYNLIFHYGDNDMPQSKAIFLRASYFTLLFFFLFVFFTMQLVEHVKTKFIYWGELFWGLVLAYIFLPIPKIKNENRTVFYKLLISVIITPCIPMNFMIIWVTEQLASFNQPFGDFFYTACYVIRGETTWCRASTPNFAAGYIMIIFLYRIIQSAKFFHQITMARADKKYDFMAGPFIGLIRATLSFLTAGAGVLNRLKVFPNSMGLWIVLAIVTTIYSWLVDLKGDWGLLDYRAGKLLRQKLLFPKAKKLYYSAAIIDLLLRTAWVFNISPLIVSTKGLSNYLFVMMISYLELFRRAVWNILRVEFQHVKNCNQFQATNKDDHILKQVQNKADAILQDQEKAKKSKKGTFVNLGFDGDETQDEKRDKQDQGLGKHRRNQQLDLFKSKLKEREEVKKQNSKINDILESKLDKIIGFEEAADLSSDDDDQKKTRNS